ncbi:hemerythrin domain-containing protein [Vibrio sp. SCSIO 43136]|uniref:hemerythrin domain-containing protein n=1 Tax=Vibrio sp. SCSIO 43136 TaxID=2819101 RepID=UPI0020761CF0|nr:hemerythrin domain-containing protein [Vibrio sp. SCSIO 43136]USD65733.1 hemerythrin domain-containing protein [Vibrio sp. SCSIO 43136]
MMLERIRREHGYMMRLLAILRKKLNALKNEEPINYSLVKEVVDYLCNHSERTHHPKEDILYLYYLEKYPDAAEVANLEADHGDLANLTHEFLDTIEMILQDAVVPQDIFIQKLEEFIAKQKQHLELEEQQILPKIADVFTTEDWQYVESKWHAEEDDPLFGDTIADRYKQLAERVRQVDTEQV